MLYYCYCTTFSELSGRLALCCEVMTNICITESEAVKSDETFTSIAVLSLQIGKLHPHPSPPLLESWFHDIIFHAVKENECSRLSLSAALLSLLITRRQGNAYSCIP